MVKKTVKIRKSKKFYRYSISSDKITQRIVATGVNMGKKDKERLKKTYFIDNLSEKRKKVYNLEIGYTIDDIALLLKKDYYKIEAIIRNIISTAIFSLDIKFEETIKKVLLAYEWHIIELFIEYPESKVKEKLNISDELVSQSILCIKKLINKSLSEDEKNCIKSYLSIKEIDVMDKWFQIADEEIIKTSKRKSTELSIAKVKSCIEEHLSIEKIQYIKELMDVKEFEKHEELVKDKELMKLMHNKELIDTIEKVFDLWFGYSLESMKHKKYFDEVDNVRNKCGEVIGRDLSYDDIKSIKERLTDSEREVFDMWVKYSIKNIASMLEKMKNPYKIYYMK